MKIYITSSCPMQEAIGSLVVYGQERFCSSKRFGTVSFRVVIALLESSFARKLQRSTRPLGTRSDPSLRFVGKHISRIPNALQNCSTASNRFAVSVRHALEELYPKMYSSFSYKKTISTVSPPLGLLLIPSWAPFGARCKHTCY